MASRVADASPRIGDLDRLDQAERRQPGGLKLMGRRIDVRLVIDGSHRAG